jgi:hypothetical protein
MRAKVCLWLVQFMRFLHGLLLRLYFDTSRSRCTCCDCEGPTFLWPISPDLRHRHCRPSPLPYRADGLFVLPMSILQDAASAYPFFLS